MPAGGTFQIISQMPFYTNMWSCQTIFMGLLNWLGVGRGQRNYYEHIIQNERAYLQISKYIVQNPEHWEGDRFRNK